MRIADSFPLTGHGPRFEAFMIIDCHVHACATRPGHGKVSEYLLRSWSFRFLRWRLGIPSDDAEGMEREAEARLLQTIEGAGPIERAVVLAFDGVYNKDGAPD